MLKEFPDTEKPDEVSYMIIQSDYYYATNSVAEKQEDRYRKAIDRAEEFLARYPESKYSKEVTRLKLSSEKAITRIDYVRY